MAGKENSTDQSILSDKYYGKATAGIATISLFHIFQIINVISRHLSVAFGIKSHNVGIYISKLYSFRALIGAIGSAVEGVLFEIVSRSGRDATYVRKAISVISFVLIAICRIVFIFNLYTSPELAISSYRILLVESFFFGSFVMALFPLTPQHNAVTSICMEVSGLSILIPQSILDRLWFHRPLLLIKIQAIYVATINVIAIPMWYYYLYYTNPEPRDKKEKEKKRFECKNFKRFEYRDNIYEFKVIDPGFFGHIWGAFSGFMMYTVGSLVHDVIFPGIIPYGLLTPDKAHLVNLMIPITNLIGPTTIVIIDQLDEHEIIKGHVFKTWHAAFDTFWLCLIPVVIVNILTFMAIHTDTLISKKIMGNRTNVLIMFLFFQTSYRFLEVLSFVSVSNYTFHVAHGAKSAVDVLVAMNLLFVFYTFLYGKLSVGYNMTRNKNAFAMRIFHPTYKFNKFESICYWIKESFRMGWRDTVNDFKLDITACL